MQTTVARTDTGLESTASGVKSASHGGRLITIHRPERRDLILQLLNSLLLEVQFFKQRKDENENWCLQVGDGLPK
jgi:hypothetical protein